jgi:hypothetical protein
MAGYVENINVPGDYVKYELLHDYQATSRILPYLYPFPKEEYKTQQYLDYLNSYLSQILEHNHNASSTKFICICGLSFMYI